ncbi:mandelate racemase/muconate lactonizing enzyme family protein [Nesterenkonia muleiensis]|uniref:mandelate racemase/muconate lactonizing enzyme family protein n=1 Tax=Nesterenkonia muleiensis TaxID=2282648 RepID=UPI00308314F4
MKITAIESVPYTIPSTRPLRFASGEVTEANHVLVKIHTDTGISGVSDTPPRPFTYGETQGSVISVIQDIFAPQLVGMNPLDREKARSVMARTLNNATAKGSLDIALWDILGKILQIPVSQMLGGFTDRLAVSHMLGFKAADELVDEAVQMRESYGISTFKLKVGRRPVARDVEAARALRGFFGDKVDLYMDANRGWTAAETGRVLEQITELDIQFFGGTERRRPTSGTPLGDLTCGNPHRR